MWDHSDRLLISYVLLFPGVHLETGTGEWTHDILPLAG